MCEPEPAVNKDSGMVLVKRCKLQGVDPAWHAQWQSPISSELITGKSTGLGAAQAGPDGLVYWLEGRPTEGGRMVLVRRLVIVHACCVQPVVLAKHGHVLHGSGIAAVQAEATPCRKDAM